MKLTFVTAFLNLRETRDMYRKEEEHLNHFREMAKTGINIICFLSKEYVDDFKDFATVRVVPFELEDLDTYKMFKNSGVTKLPILRNYVKDTYNFMVLMNAKTEFIYRAMEIDDSSHFAWIDFGVYHVFSDKHLVSSTLKMMSESVFVDSFLAISGCHEFKRIDLNFIVDQIFWRFCGGFFIGDRFSLQNFYNVIMDNLMFFLKNFGISWEVNVWAYLEIEKKITVDWFLGDHNELLINVPAKFLM